MLLSLPTLPPTALTTLAPLALTAQRCHRDYHKDQQHCHEDQCKDRHRQHDHQDYDANHGPGLKRYINCSTKLKP